MAKTFICPCGEQWYKCSIHRDITREDTADGSSTHAADNLNKAASKKTLSMRARDERLRKERENDLEGNFKVVKKRKPAFETAFRASMLSAGLKRKFAYLCQNDGD